jgi:fucose permease
MVEPGDETSTPEGHRRVALAAICLATFAYVGVESALTFFVADHAQRDLGLAADRASGVVGFFWSGLLAGRLTIGLLPYEPSARMTSVLALASSGVVFGFFIGGIGSPEVAMSLAGLFLGGVFPIMIGLAGMTLPGATGKAVGLAAGVGSLGGFLVPWLTGMLATRTDLATALATLSLWLFTLVGAAAMVHHRHPHRL